jgi:hypothetical protein
MLTALELIYQDIADPVVRENFFRISNFLTQNTPLLNFKFFEVDIKANQQNPTGSSPIPVAHSPIAHGLAFTPLDVIVMSAQGNQKYYFLNQFFDATNLYVTVAGPVRLRFLVGRFTDPGYEKPPVNFVFTPPF